MILNQILTVEIELGSNFNTSSFVKYFDPQYLNIQSLTALQNFIHAMSL